MSTFVAGGNVSANGIRQHYLRYGGKGHALILVPGITSPAITWGFVAERLGHYFDTYVLDVRGRGLSSSGPDLDYGTDACAADIPAFAAALGLDSYHLLGHSMGRVLPSAQPPKGHRDCSGWCWSTHRCPGRAAAPTRASCRGTSIRSAKPRLA